MAEYLGSLNAIRGASVAELAAIYGVGETVAESVVAWFTDKKNQNELDLLLKHLTIEAVATTTASAALSGKTLVFTGTLPTLTRDEAKDKARLAGAIVSNSVSKKTSYVVAGSEAGSKADKAVELGVSLLSEAEFLELLA